MANLGSLNKLMNFQKFWQCLHCQHYLQFSPTGCSNSVVDLVRSHHTQWRACAIQSKRRTCTLHSAINTALARRFYCTEKSTSSNSSTTTRTSASTFTASPPSIDEFRAREEQREEEFVRKQEETEPKRPSNSEDEDKRLKVEAIRGKVLAAALKHVPALGWTRNAIVQGAEDAGLPSVVHGMFPEGGFALVSYFNCHCNEQLVQRLQQETQSGQHAASDHVDFLVRAVRTRLEMLIPYKSHWPQAMALIALPQNASTALAQVLTLVDDICYFAGDRSVDIGWYTRRIGLATIMKMTELYMLQDNSADHARTWEFLRNRMDEAVQLQMMLSQSEDVTHRLQRSFNSAFITARNILGLGYNR